MINQLKQKLLAGKSVFGPWIETTSIDNAEILANIGADFIMIDGEHGAMDFETAGRMISQIKYTNTSPLLRVPGNDMFIIKQYLDTGAAGIMIPMVNSKAEAEKAVSFCNYPPKGVRGIGAGRNCLFANQLNEYLSYSTEGDGILVILQIEHIDAVNNIDEILTVPGIDIAFVGPFDLSASMNLLGQIDHPKILEAIDKVLISCKKHNIIPGTITTTERLKKHIDQGFRVLIGGMDGQFIFEGGRKLVEEFKDAIKK